MKVIGIIPARYGSTRFPGKPLAMIDGKTMIQRVYEQAAQALEEVWVATDDYRIADAVASFGGCYALTSAEHKNGTQRCAEVARTFKLADDDIVINIQGDQPYIDPNYIKELMSLMGRTTAPIGTLIVSHLLTAEEIADKNCVKAYVDKIGIAREFSRQLPEHPDLIPFKHIGTYAYRAGVLRILASLPYPNREASLEQTEWLKHFSIHCTAVVGDVISIDVPEDLMKLDCYDAKDDVCNIFEREAKAIQQIPITMFYNKAVALIYERVHKQGGKLITTGMGKAGQVADDIATTFASTGTPAVFLHPAEAQHGDLGILQKNDVLLMISNSGQTREVMELFDLKSALHNIPTILITGHPESGFAQMVDCVIDTGNPAEVCPLGLTPTTSTTVMGVIGDVLVVLMMKRIGFTKEEYAKRHHGGYLGQKAREDGSRESR